MTDEVLLMDVEPWPDELLDAHGHHPCSIYVERYWLPVLGPSTTFMARRLADGFAYSPDGFQVELNALGAWLGLGAVGRSRHNPTRRALERLVRFTHARWTGPTRLAVHRRFPDVSEWRLRDLPADLQRRHSYDLSLARRHREHQAPAG